MKKNVWQLLVFDKTNDALVSAHELPHLKDDLVRAYVDNFDPTDPLGDYLLTDNKAGRLCADASISGHEDSQAYSFTLGLVRLDSITELTDLPLSTKLSTGPSAP